MATSKEYIEYVCGQIKGESNVRYKKMFGDYMVYVDEKPLLLVCDNTVFVKILPALGDILSKAEKGYPYVGAKEHYIIDPDDENFNDIIAVLKQIIPAKKKR